MTVAKNYAKILRKVNVALPEEMVQEVLDIVGEFTKSENIRKTQKGDYSVYDFLAYVCKKINPSKAWTDLTTKYPEVLTFCYDFKFEGKGQKESPVASLVNLIAIAYLIPGEYGNRLRQSSAQLIVSSLETLQESLDEFLKAEEAIANATPAFPYSDIDLHRMTGYAALSYTRDVIRKDYQLNIDYIEIEKRMYLSMDAIALALNAARSNKGCKIPDEIKQHPFPWDKLCQREKIKINRRRVQNDEPTIPGFELT